MPVEIVLLDTPAVRVEDDLHAVSRAREQAVLARLALAAPAAVPVDVLVEDVWGPTPPSAAVEALRVHVSNLRKVLSGAGAPADVVRTERGSYRLDLPRAAVDVSLLEDAVRTRDLPTVARFCVSPASGDLARYEAGSGFFDDAARAVVELQAHAVELHATDRLASGHGASVVDVLERCVRNTPYREPLWELLVRCLASAGRRADALRAAQRARHALAEVGLTPGPAIAAIETEVYTAMEAPASAVANHYVEVDGSRIAYSTRGSHPVDLLFLHGGFIPFETMRDTPRLAAFLDQVQRRFRVIFVDRRGIGMSDPPVDGGPVQLEHWVSDCAAVLEAADAHNVIVFGHEHAGPVAIELAARVPERVRGLVLHSTAARPLRSADHPYGPDEHTLERLDRMIDRLPGSEDILRIVAPDAGDDPQLRAWMDRAGRLGAGPTRAKEMHRTYLHSDVRATLARVRVPAVVLHPARMVRTDPGQARYLAEHLPNAELRLLDSANHLFWIAERDVSAVLDALEQVRPAALDQRVAPKRIHALLAVAGDSDALSQAIEFHDATAVLRTAEGVLVGVFDTIEAAKRCAASIAVDWPAVATKVEVADVHASADDPAVAALTSALQR